MEYKLGCVKSSEALINDLYIELRRKINSWAGITHQTAQARMGYVGQHLVSIATGFPGGKSGARGKDLVISNTEHAEIKTCYRVDQLGKCNDCGAVLASIEAACSVCASENLKRNDDSKWLISIRHDQEFDKILEPKFYYLVLFDYTDLANPDTIRASIWEVDSLSPGFAYALVDYYLNIRSKSTSKAPFNLWPFQLKFDLMKGRLIYRSYIKSDDSIETEIFPSINPPVVHPLRPLKFYSRSTNLTIEKLINFAHEAGIRTPNGGKKNQIIKALDDALLANGGYSEQQIDLLAKKLYWPEIEPHIQDLPPTLKAQLGAAGLI